MFLGPMSSGQKFSRRRTFPGTAEPCWNLASRGDCLMRLRLFGYRDLSKVAERAGVWWVGHLGSDSVFQNPGGRVVVTPDHGS